MKDSWGITIARAVRAEAGARRGGQWRSGSRRRGRSRPVSMTVLRRPAMPDTWPCKLCLRHGHYGDGSFPGSHDGKRTGSTSAFSALPLKNAPAPAVGLKSSVATSLLGRNTPPRTRRYRTLNRPLWPALSLYHLGQWVSVGCVMSTYRSYCQGQASECKRRAQLASSPEIAAHFQKLGLEWLRLAEKERAKARLRPTPTRLAAEAVQVVTTARSSWRSLLGLQAA